MARDSIAPAPTVGKAGPMTEPQYRRVLVPLDGSAFAALAVRTARALAERFGADLGAVSAAESPGDVEKLRSHAADALGLASAEHERVSVVVGDDPAAAIGRRVAGGGWRVAELESCLVCLSTHGHGRFAGAVIGRSPGHCWRAPGDRWWPSARPPTAPGRPSRNRRRRSPSPLVACVDGRPASDPTSPGGAATARRRRPGTGKARAASGPAFAVMRTPAVIGKPGRWCRSFLRSRTCA